MKSSKMLRKAKKLLSTGVADCNKKTSHICFALCDASDSPKDMVVGDQLIERVQYLLGGFANVTDWLAYHGYSKYPHSVDKVQAYRHRWVNHLIREYKAKGD